MPECPRFPRNSARPEKTKALGPSAWRNHQDPHGPHPRARRGQFRDLSAPVYIKGFIRTCATVLKMDVPVVMARLDAELKGSEKFSEPPPFSDEPKGFLDFVMLQLSKLDWRNEPHRSGSPGRRAGYFVDRNHRAAPSDLRSTGGPEARGLSRDAIGFRADVCLCRGKRSDALRCVKRET